MIQFVFAALSIALCFPHASAEADETCGTSLENVTVSEARFRAMANEAAEKFYDDNHTFKGPRPRVVAYRVEQVYRRGPRSATVVMTLEVDHGSTPDPISIYVVIDDERVKLTGTTPLLPFPETEGIFAAPTFDENDVRVQGVFKRAARRFIETTNEWGILKPHTKILSIKRENNVVTARTMVMFATKKQPDFWDQREVEVRYNSATGFEAAYVD